MTESLSPSQSRPLLEVSEGAAATTLAGWAAESWAWAWARARGVAEQNWVARAGRHVKMSWAGHRASGLAMRAPAGGGDGPDALHQQHDMLVRS